ncbi:lysine-2,3-aminomutase-like protein [Hyphomicrobium sulfonivorans]|uniref:lysine-2,3-aminomutase-like protein n=1 Tax=Hyphomicrobium sulfonivorans TaxID=121290 RepID=UPI0015714248|nr:lysine-2,3-aminomutase-like protein [Hyphomicrobium sulfonivorans]MBI1650327.1 lysine-2,3-aminomutase-like protein [Hyphomicrobium sulfonivorans]NSL72310.1 lysine-2,3-aminomutase-like protein [Hyphomicrobium sulfonivorans]
MTAFRRTLTSTDDLADAGLIPARRADELAPVGSRYAVAVTPAMAALIDTSNPDDPIARQFIPDPRELDILPEENADPIGDTLKSPVPGIVHRYPDRVLLKLVHVCPVYCRFCFRREMVGPGKSNTLGEHELQAALDYIRATPQIWEVILTGGDPLILSPRRIAEVTAALDAIDHVKIIRWHSRVPVVAPERVTDAMVKALKAPRKTVYVALHANHPRELTDAARNACSRMIDSGVAMVSQTVLLRGVNDNVETLAALMRAFVENRIKPYYLHHGDLAPGTAHLRTSIEEGQALMQALRSRISGLAMPTYVLDIPGAHGKVPIGPNYVHRDGDSLCVSDPRGETHAYPGSSTR